ncbi:DUF1127 domain-containing protein [Ensifer adhaerens]|uniref:DUF1127 domain-containing protein n=1 Tax=Ensifer adhaerens TaxID=106592 RepID=UPI000AA96D85|nr:DUF1127 domain-containing protein [Ensifer adhaerens]
MDDTPTLASAPHQASRPRTPVGPAEVSRRHYSLATLRSIIATWDERKRVRCDLERKLKEDPYLIDDIGLTRRQVEAEIAKPFWQA